VTAYSVIQRRSEIGVRIALGSTRRGISALVLRRVGWLAGIGLLCGVLISLWAARFVRSLLFGLDPHDPSTFSLAICTIATVFALATWVPARRAARMNPSAVLREG
jgi:putative ABC transport system permease protein